MRTKNIFEYQHYIGAVVPIRQALVISLLEYYTEAYSEPSWTTKVEFFAKIFSGFETVTIFTKSSIVDTRLNS